MKIYVQGHLLKLPSHLFNKYLLFHCYVPGTVLDARDTLNKTNKIPDPMELTFQRERKKSMSKQIHL